MNFIMYTDLWVMFCTLVGMIYGLITLQRKTTPLFARMICWAVVCTFFARFFLVVYHLIHRMYDFNINIGTLGILGGILFLLSANYGQIDRLVDDRKRKMWKTRLIAMLGPLVILGLFGYFFWLWYGLDLAGIVNMAIITIFILPAIYYNLKHAIIYDVKGGIVRSLRLYNICAVLYELMVMVEFITFRIGLFEIYTGAMVVQGILILLILPVVRGGVKKWTT